MQKTTIYLMAIFLILLSCGESDLYKTKSGEFASISGNFIVKFPKEPVLSVIDNKVGLQEYEIYHFGTALTPKKMFYVEYIDFPPNEINGYTDEELHSRTIGNLLFKLQNKFKLEYQENIVQHGLKGKFYILEFKDKKERKNGYMTGKLFRVKNRIYTISYLGIDEKTVDPYMKSFRLLKKN